jgi:hypothetical protein
VNTEADVESAKLDSKGNLRWNHPIKLNNKCQRKDLWECQLSLVTLTFSHLRFQSFWMFLNSFYPLVRCLGYVYEQSNPKSRLAGRLLPAYWRFKLLREHVQWCFENLQRPIICSPSPNITVITNTDTRKIMNLKFIVEIFAHTSFLNPNLFISSSVSLANV